MQRQLSLVCSTGNFNSIPLPGKALAKSADGIFLDSPSATAEPAGVDGLTQFLRAGDGPLGYHLSRTFVAGKVFKPALP
jgi:hypothetical protein